MAGLTDCVRWNKFEVYFKTDAKKHENQDNPSVHPKICWVHPDGSLGRHRHNRRPCGRPCANGQLHEGPGIGSGMCF
jgi:hypothetical protein